MSNTWWCVDQVLLTGVTAPEYVMVLVHTPCAKDRTLLGILYVFAKASFRRTPLWAWSVIGEIHVARERVTGITSGCCLYLVNTRVATLISRLHWTTGSSLRQEIFNKKKKFLPGRVLRTFSSRGEEESAFRGVLWKRAEIVPWVRAKVQLLREAFKGQEWLIWRRRRPMVSSFCCELFITPGVLFDSTTLD